MKFNNKKNIDISIIAIVVFLIILYITIFSLITLYYHNRFHTPAYDLGTSDHFIWKIFNSDNYFSTVTGTNIFSGHLRFIFILLSPLTFIFGPSRYLLVLQSIFLGLAAIPLYFIAKEKLGPKVSLLVIVSYFLYPALHFLNFENFHIDSLMPLLFFSAFYFTMKKRFKYYYPILFLILIVKEEMAFTVLLFGIYLYFKCNKKVGAITFISSIIWIFLSFVVFFPLFNPEGGYQFFSRVGGDSTAMGTFQNLFSSVRGLISRLFTYKNLVYVFHLLAPVAFLALLSPSTLFISANIYINLLVNWPYAHSIKYHYTATIIPFVFISLVFALSKLKKMFYLSKLKKFKLYPLILIILVISAILSNIYIGPDKTSITKFKKSYNRILNFNEFSEKDQLTNEIINSFSSSDSISAHYTLVPHLTHREIIYMWPNPFKVSYWGPNSGENLPTKDVDYIFLNNRIKASDQAMIDSLVENKYYDVVISEKGLLLLKRNPEKSPIPWANVVDAYYMAEAIEKKDSNICRKFVINQADKDECIDTLTNSS